MSDWNPSPAQRKAMAEATHAWNWSVCGSERRLDMVDEMIAAANSVPDGPVVGTIARREDGMFIAVRCGPPTGESHWLLVRVIHGVCALTGTTDDADSWPVIYDPTKTVKDSIFRSGGQTFETGPRPRIAAETPTVVPEPRTPRVLETLDCEEARDGTVWEAHPGLSGIACRWQFAEGDWRCAMRGHAKGCGAYPSDRDLTQYGPYTEVPTDE